MKTLTIFERASDIHLEKDVGQLMEAFCLGQGCENTLLTNNKIVNSLERTEVVTIKRRSIKNIDISVVNYLIFNSRRFAILTLFHVRIYNLIYALIFLILTLGKGRVYIKADRGDKDLELFGVFDSFGVKRSIERIILKLIKNKLLISYESNKALSLARSELGGNYKMSYIPNGHNIGVPNNGNKENVIVSVGRIGAKEKNHMHIITTLINTNIKNRLKDFDIYLVGPFCDEFEEYLSEQKQHCSFLKEHVHLIGNLEKPALYELYNRSKYFILPSLREGSPLVLPEALYFGLVFITTPVSTVGEITSGSAFISKDFSEEEFAKSIDEALALSDEELEVLYKNNKMIARDLSWEKIALKLYKELCLNDFINE